jgi:predicted RNase H-like nuclease
MAGRPRRPGPQLPYRVLGGAEPCRRGWLLAIGKLQGISLLPEQFVVLPSFLDVLDYRPSFDVLAVHVPIGLPTEPNSRGRSCDQAARQVLGWPRSGAIVSAPCRAALQADTYAEARRLNGGRLSVVQWQMRRRFAEVDAVIGSYHQRTVFEVHPELGFHQMNDDTSLRHRKHSEEGHEERRALILGRLPGVERILDEPVAGAGVPHVYDACADLWTARRIAARALQRLPEDPEWDEMGLRMEIVR